METLVFARWKSWAVLLPICLVASLRIIWMLIQFIDLVWWTPKRHAIVAQKQGLRGPAPRLLLGNVMEIKRLRESVPDALHAFRHDLTLQQLLPENVLWSKLYGKNHLIWWGPDANIVMTDMDILKELLSSKHTLSLGKPLLLTRFLEPVTGIGLVLANGETWSHERRVIGPAFHSDKLKGLVQTMVNLAVNMADSWDQILWDNDGEGEIEIEGNMAELTADIIAHTQFGSSYKRGRVIFQLLEELKEFVYKYGHLLIIPGIRYVPIPAFRRLRRMTLVVETSIQDIIKDRKAAVQAGENSSYGADLLGLMLSESEKNSQDKKQPQLTMQQLVDECKTFFFAGHETTAQLLTWALLLLAHDSTWQDKARAEIVSLCKGKIPDFESISKMKTVEMILFETLRLFTPANSIIRAALCDMKVGDLHVLKGMCFWIPIASIHLDPELWGDGVYDFNPERFAEGISKAAKHPMAFLPFAHGPRNCIGQGFALMEAKLVLATLLPRFSFAPSPSYRHCPQLMITTRPKYGAPIIVKKLSS
ncbi:hypothetical protein GOP47_0000781 [Adiantum capillus-veneris]|uniref:Cytochrome P450 n=1 Tax=Adiantum capillus-veneris TaxID=13818 RepID=A0A9D4VFR7_ADICA|nr:hypothetical protein GOP47_0000781 [Adiantum capillus-veneris]